ncbi:MAG: lipid II flippase MurJ [Bdellovibrionota bacterium]
MNNPIKNLLAQIARDSFIVIICTIIAKALTLGKDIYLAGVFGVGFDLDVYLIAFSIPFFLSSVVLNVTSSLAIPEFVKSDQVQQTDQIFLPFLLLAFFSSSLILFLCFIFQQEILSIFASGFSGEKFSETKQIFLSLACILPIRSISGISSALLQANKKFITSTLAQAVLPTVMIAVLFQFTGKYSNTILLAYATLAGFCAEAVWLLFAVLRKYSIFKKADWHYCFRRIRVLIPQAGALAIGSITLGSMIIIDQAMASTLSQGSVSSLGFGLRLAEVLIFLTAAAVSTSVFPYFSNLVEANDFKLLKVILNKIVLYVLLLCLVPTILFCYFSENLVSLVYQRGLFTDSDTFLVAQIQTMYVLQVPFYTASLVYVRLFSALRKNEILMFSTLFTVVANIALNYILMKYMGVAGIALSTALVNVLVLVFLSANSHKILSKN